MLPGMRAALITTLVLTLLAPALAGPPPVVRESAHYRVEAEASIEATEEMVAVLEAAWPQYRNFFKAAPELEEGRKLMVFYGKDRSSFHARIRKDGAYPPQSGGYYSPRSKTAYLWRQPTIYYTRCLLLHEAAHQFHYLSRTRNKSPGFEWYTEGVAEHVCRHRWDGETLVLGILPTLSLKDYAAAALAKFREKPGLLEAVVTGAEKDRSLYWAVVRYLAVGDDGKWKSKFERLRDRLDRGGASKGAFSRVVGSPRRVEPALVAWLKREQEPWKQIFNQWEGIAPGRFRGTAPPVIVTSCRVKANARRITATVEDPGTRGWMAGLLLSHEDRDNYVTAFVVNGREVRVTRRLAGKWVRLVTRPCPAPSVKGRHRMKAERVDGKVVLTVEGQTIGAWELPSSWFGLSQQGGVVQYRDVTWE